ncbi:hypothetical protein LSUB1_G004771 [Lachnellula subtilissima]|uniref:N-acetyltransferase domain-containing protein n=1 Tax=Lachnellula subtilissima TaxID=602034 RepID=A0A8H8RPH4_9HELO|nr:hypothetical protein LSUB1_G004771 [Lachnellula subtilissima]
MANFSLETATISDTNELGQLMALAHKNDPIQRNLLPFALRERLLERQDSDKLFSSKIVAFAKVRYPGPEDSKGDFEGEPPEGTDMQTLVHWFEQMDAYHAKHASYEKDYCIPSSPPSALFPKAAHPKLHISITNCHIPDLNVLCVHPSYQRLGLGKMLLTRFLVDADKEHARVYLQATELGHPLYLKCGWVDIEDMVTQTPEGPVVWKCMMREPGAGATGMI